jgi:LCP family protein required for cell wall assembly
VPTWTLPFGPSVTPAPFETQPAADTPLPVEAGTPTPTARPGIDPTLDTSAPDPFSQLVTPVPEPMPQLFLDDDIVNILLLGRDTAKGSGSYRTDVMIVVSINKTANSVTLLTIPRDLFVYIPGWTMNRINTASAHGDAIGYPGGGVALLEQTILYNLGLPIHGWARIDFDGFKQVIDILGGVDLPVSCAMQDWRLKDPYDVSVDVQDADNWHLYTVEPGVQHMDGDLALWYARSRKRSSDFDRSRRQHQVLRAMLDKGLQLNVLPRAPELYQQYVQIVDTDLGIGDVLQFVPMAAGIDRTRIKSRFIGRAEVWSWTTPQGAAVLLPDRAAIARLLEEAFQPPAENVLARAGRSVEIWNGTLNGDWAALATDNLAWAGIASTVGQADRTDYATTLLFDYTSSPKGSIRAELQMIFHIRDENVVVLSDPNAGSAYRVVLGSDYDSCVRPPQAIHPTPTPAPGEPPPVAEAEIVHAARIVGTPPTVGGDISEWTALVYPVNQPSFGRQNWTGPDDLSVSWNTAWDDKYLYLAGKVKDDVLVQNATGENLFRGDSLEIWLSVDPGSRTETLSEREFQFGVSFGDLNSSAPAPTAYLWMPAQYKGPVQDALIAAGRVEDGYTFEIAIPWSVFRLTPFSWQGLGLTLAFNDNDSSGTTAQESQIVNRKDAKLGDARTWGVLILDPEAGQ